MLNLKEQYKKGLITFNELLKRKKIWDQIKKWGVKPGYLTKLTPAEPREYKRNTAWGLKTEGDSKHQFGHDEAYFGWTKEEMDKKFNR